MLFPLRHGGANCLSSLFRRPNLKAATQLKIPVELELLLLVGSGGGDHIDRGTDLCRRNKRGYGLSKRALVCIGQIEGVHELADRFRSERLGKRSNGCQRFRLRISGANRKNTQCEEHEQPCLHG